MRVFNKATLKKIGAGIGIVALIFIIFAIIAALGNIIPFLFGAFIVVMVIREFFVNAIAEGVHRGKEK